LPLPPAPYYASAAASLFITTSMLVSSAWRSYVDCQDTSDMRFCRRDTIYYLTPSASPRLISVSLSLLLYDDIRFLYLRHYHDTLYFAIRRWLMAYDFTLSLFDATPFMMPFASAAIIFAAASPPMLTLPLCSFH